MSMLSLFAPTPKGMEGLLLDELRGLLGAGCEAAETRAGVRFAGTLPQAYRVCLWSRLANRVLLKLAEFPAADADALYRGVRTIDWSKHLAPSGTLAVEFNSAQSALTHTRFGAQKVKDAIVDQLREASGERPSVDTARPDVRINVYVLRDVATLYLDLAGESLHKRGYREDGAAAPLKENLAAAILLRAGWPALAAQGAPLLDPLCGSGTLPIEAALMAGDCAPGLLRAYYGFHGWRGHAAEAWAGLLDEARARRAKGLEGLPPISGYDQNANAIRSALANLDRAGLTGHVHFERRDLRNLDHSCARLRGREQTGLVVANPPYGERLGEVEELKPLYRLLGEKLLAEFPGWRASVFTNNTDLGKAIGLRAHKLYTLFNGALECRVLNFEVSAERIRHERPPQPVELGEGAQQFANRLRKNLKHLARWAGREGIDCYRIYDADLPEYAVAVDRYGDWLHVQEYAPPKTIPADKAAARLAEVMAVLPEVCGVPAAQVVLKVRERQRGKEQYRKQAETGRFMEVREGPARLLVNLHDYLDTGLFLDHRITRALLGEWAAGQDFLNLFAYTGTASVHAALGGARSTTSVDLSRTYTQWAEKNLALNGFSGPQHRVIQADCLHWLGEERRRYGLIFIDPPTFSNSARTEQDFDVQRDHVFLLKAAAACLAPGGQIVFSNNFRRFKLDEAALAGFAIEDISRRTLPPDFARNPRIHACWRLQLR